VEDLLRLAKVFRAAQIVAHDAHNNIRGPSFFADHEFLGDVYGAYETAYDSLVERYIGLTGQPVDGISLAREALELAPDSDVQGIWDTLSMFERTICKVCYTFCEQEGVSEGTKQLVGELCNQAEMRQYKLKQRMG
jgi:DNA-binding ferritin-like protein